MPPSFADMITPLGKTLREVRFALSAALATAPLPFAGLLALYAAWGLGPALGVRVLEHVINLAIAGAGHGAAGFRPVVPWLGVFLGSLLLGDNIMWDLKDPLQQRLRQRLEADLGGRRLEAASRLPLLAFEQSETFDRLRQSDNPGEAVTDLLEGVLELLQGAVAALSLSALFVRVALWLPAVLLAALIPQGLRAARLNLQWVAFTYDQTEEQRRAGYLDRLLTGRDEQKEIRVFTLRNPLGERWRAQRRHVRRLRLAEKRRMTLRQMPSDLLPGALTLLGAVLLCLRLAHHALNAGQFIALLGGLGSFEAARIALLNSFHDLQTFAAQVGALADFLALPEVPTSRRPHPAIARPLRDGVRCEGVAFTYPGRDRPTLDGLELRIAPGERVALVGENGAGKSTLAQILLGLYPPDAGRVAIDGVDIADLTPEALHALVAGAFQDFVRFELTAGENIDLGRAAGEETSTEALLAAAQAAGADAVAADLPRGYDHPVGHTLDGGSDLSGGQWQRLALARAFRRDPALLILDEPTAALDPQAEADLYARLAAAGAAAGQAVLLISHRLGSARLADRVLVLHGGRIAEDGTHDDLVRQGGIYAHIWEEQSQWYR